MKSIDAYTKKIYNAVGRGRFAFTLLMAAAYEKFSPLVDRHEANKKLPYDEFTSYAQGSIQFLDDLCRELENQQELRRDAIVIEKILQFYKIRHEDGESWPHHSNSEPDKKTRKGTLEEFGVLQLILWHLAVISVPVEAEVLALCPLIRGALKREVNEKKGYHKNTDVLASNTSEISKDVDEKKGRCKDTKQVEEYLNLLQFRCLIYEVKARGQENLSARYGVHRLIQRHIFAQMGAPSVEYPEVDQFSLTLYARQPNDIPRLSPTAHRDLRKTVAVLSGYPEDNDAISQYESVEKDMEKRLEAPSLRAAYGILRSIYSVSGVARFDIAHQRIEDESSNDGSLFGLGFFEEHRQQIRWLGEQAKKLKDLKESEQKKEGSEGLWQYTPFYAEEIAWLYNECGVLSLVQGRLPDAFALFGLALQALDDVEPNRDTPGPLRVLVLLNLAVLDIERGRIRRAKDTLDTIIPLFSRADEEARLIAEGYRALTHHLEGNFDQAEDLYKNITPQLVKLGKSRAASIFSRHWADLLRNKGKLQDAKSTVMAALRLAQEGNHADVHHLAILSEAKIRLEDGGENSAAKPADLHLSVGIKDSDPELIHSRLDTVERYARVMGIPRMMAEVHELRSRLHLRNGDLRTAGTFARRSLEIASLHELQIRKARALILYASINFKRGFKQACRSLLEEALNITRDMRYYAAHAEAQKLWHELERTGSVEVPYAE